ncbi:CZB domain-containing protein [Accumulibacter sp.]|uniref:CZB domain-containing protein n=1 Tax=Accumulibacter sp. TaxID=2053492 RepID=UPI002633457A|nr:CZB domain-containing protein [Accumulibacter sp.]
MNNIADIEEAIGKHARWMSELRQAILEAQPGIDLAETLADDRCEFGQWLYGPTWSPEDLGTEHYQAVRRLHASFHALAAQIVTLAASGRVVDAYTLLYDDYLTMSGRLAIAMRAWQEDFRRISGVDHGAG